MSESQQPTTTSKKEKKAPQPPPNIEPKPKLSKQERRELQEKQRAAKLEKQSSGSTQKRSSLTSAPAIPPTRLQFDDPKKVAKYAKKQQVVRATVQKQVALFSHLPQLERETSLSLQVGFVPEEVHPAVVRLGLRFAEGVYTGSNSRCLALLEVLKEVVRDYQRPADQVFSWDLDRKLKPNIRFLNDCRPSSISMGNAIAYVKRVIMKTAPELPDEQAKEKIILAIDEFVQERIEYADRLISKAGVARIQNGQTILVYSKSHVVEMILLQAKQEGKTFHVIVVDSRPKLEGKLLLKRLLSQGIRCSYVMISSISYVMRRVSLVFVGAHGMLSNGAALSRVGTGLVALMAQAHNVPFIVCCETYKFCVRSQVDSITSNELRDPDELISLRKYQKDNILTDWRDISSLKLLNLAYDVTPVDLVSVILTEVGDIPPTAVPVIIREYVQ